MATVKQYIKSRIEQEKTVDDKLNVILATLEELKEDSEANAGAIEELALIIAGGED